jgi:hypothetical protein
MMPAIISASDESLTKGFLQEFSSLLIMGNVYSTHDFGKLFRVSQIHFKKRQQTSED